MMHLKNIGKSLKSVDTLHEFSKALAFRYKK